MSNTPQMPPPGKLAVTINEMAALIGVGENSAYEISKREDFPLFHYGTRIVIPVDCLRQWLADQVKKERPAACQPLEKENTYEY